MPADNGPPQKPGNNPRKTQATPGNAQGTRTGPNHASHEPPHTQPADSRRTDDAPPGNKPTANKPTANKASDNAAPDHGQECAYRQDHTTDRAARYRPAQSLTDLITATFSTCTFPQCGRPATHCDLDHLRPFSQNGPTCICNLHPACRRHHQLKTTGQWQARPSRPHEPYPAGTIIWTTPDGRSHPSTLSLPGQPSWSPTQPTDPQALRQALKARETPTARENRTDTSGQPDQPESTPHHLTHEDTMPTKERTRLRQERWQKDLQRRPSTSPRPNRRTQQENRTQHHDPTQPEGQKATPTTPFSRIWPSPTIPHHQAEEPPF
jgi:hypothetical protein